MYKDFTNINFDVFESYKVRLKSELDSCLRDLALYEVMLHLDRADPDCSITRLLCYETLYNIERIKRLSLLKQLKLVEKVLKHE